MCHTYGLRPPRGRSKTHWRCVSTLFDTSCARRSPRPARGVDPVFVVPFVDHTHRVDVQYVGIAAAARALERRAYSATSQFWWQPRRARPQWRMYVCTCIRVLPFAALNILKDIRTFTSCRNMSAVMTTMASAIVILDGDMAGVFVCRDMTVAYNHAVDDDGH